LGFIFVICNIVLVVEYANILMKKGRPTQPQFSANGPADWCINQRNMKKDKLQIYQFDLVV